MENIIYGLKRHPKKNPHVIRMAVLKNSRKFIMNSYFLSLCSSATLKIRRILCIIVVIWPSFFMQVFIVYLLNFISLDNKLLPFYVDTQVLLSTTHDKDLMHNGVFHIFHLLLINYFLTDTFKSCYFYFIVKSYS